MSKELKRIKAKLRETHSIYLNEIEEKLNKLKSKYVSAIENL